MSLPFGLYIHIPFCVSKCRYCDFLSFPADRAARKAYLSRLIREMRVRSSGLGSRKVRTVFIGGGTPSILGDEQISRLMEAVFSCFDVEEGAEISMECNPGTGEALSFRNLRSAGINRLSLGLQSMDDEQLRLLGRIHTKRQFLESYEKAREGGFDNINIDIMSGLPGQSLASWMRTLDEVCALKPEHISAYSLIVEEGTPFYSIYGEGAGRPSWPPLPDEDTERDMYHEAEDFLKGQGYTHYEISNFARSGYECRHNLAYWLRGDYLGLGLGAASLIDHVRSANTRDLDIYMKHSFEADAFLRSPLCAEYTKLSEKDRMEETMFLGLRCSLGVGCGQFEETFGKDIYSVYGPVIDRYEKLGLLEEKGGRIRLTRAGIDVSNVVMADFLLD